MEFNGNDMFVANSAGSRGAAIHTSFATTIFQGSIYFGNNSADNGGGISSESSNLTFIPHGFSHHTLVSPPCINCRSVCNDRLGISDISFLNNTAHRGGAQYFDLYSNFSLFKQHMCTFRTIVQLSLVVQYMSQMYLNQASSFLSNAYTFEVSVSFTCFGKFNLESSTRPL